MNWEKQREKELDMCYHVTGEYICLTGETVLDHNHLSYTL